MPVTKACEHCGVTFSYRPDPRRERKYCSHDCYWTAQRGGLPAENKDGTRTCTGCGEAKPPEAFRWSNEARGKRHTQCRVCQRAKGAEYRKANPDKCREVVRACWEKNREAYLAQKRKYYHANKERLALKRKEWYQKNREALLAYYRAWREENREYARECSRRYYKKNKAALQRRNRAYYEENREQARQARRRYYARHREEAIRKSVEWGRANPQRRRVYTQNYRARRREAEGRFTPKDVVRLWHHQRGECARCGHRFGKRPGDGGYQVDHITPLSRGGTNWPRNLQLLCDASGNSCNQRKLDKTPAEFTLYLRQMASLD